MKSMLRTTLIGLLCLVLSLTGCSALQASDLMAGVEAAEWPDSPATPDEQFTGSMTRFSWELLQKSMDNPGNILISPASVYLALAMTLNGADTTTREAMLATLSAEDLTVAEIDAACRDWITLLCKEEPETVLQIANSIWYRDGFNPDPAFVQANADFFAAGAKMLDFNKPEAVDIINNWVKTATRGKIEKMLEEIGPAVVMYLINTLYFKADWKTPFIKNYSAQGTFRAPDGDLAALFMHGTDDRLFLALQDCTGILLPYTDSQFAFFAILPPEGMDARQLVKTKDARFLGDILASATTQSVKLTLPAFKTSYSDSLINELESMGMGIAFNGGADFSLMNAEHSKNLFISEIKHKTFIDLNEKGTEAAAATLVEISKTGLPQEDVVLTFDRPFLYGILDQLTGQPVFIGILEKP
jgi:serine protease inhibitor